MSETVFPLHTQVCIVGGGPAGVMCAYLLAFQGVEVVLLEGEQDFDREFRGDTLHASSLEILDQLGHAGSVLELASGNIDYMQLETSGQSYRIADFSLQESPFPYVTIIPQDIFLNYMVIQANAFSNFTVIMNARVFELIKEQERVCGVIFKHDGRNVELTADLTIGADGRGSTIRRLAGLELARTSPPMDVLWFKLPVPKIMKGRNTINARLDKGHILITINRREYLQIGYVIIKGSFKELRMDGLTRFKSRIVRLMPALNTGLSELKDWSQISVLSVVTGRVRKWYREGLLLIGDAAHVMSPVGGVGINYAIQDAVATANLLSEDIKEERLTLASLKSVQRCREPSIKFIQWIQEIIQKNLIRNALKSEGAFKPPVSLKVINRFPYLQKRLAGIMAYGLRTEKIINRGYLTDKRL